ncbi:MAG: M4 family metallopeptidase, partial [Roseiflexaceae bacterium]
MRTRRVLPTLMICLLVAGLMPSAQPSSAAPAQADLVASLRAQTDGHLRVAYHAETGKARFIGTESAHPLPRPAALPAGAAPALAARQFLGAYGALFGLRDQAQELTVMREVTGEGHSFVRFQQVYQGIPILGGELIVQVDQARNIVSANGEVLPDLRLDTRPRIDAAAAHARALEALAAQYGVDPDELTVSTPELWVFNPALLGGPGLRRNTLTWRMELRGESATTAIRELVLIDAHVGIVVLHFNQIADAKSRRICNANNVADPDGDETNDCDTDAKAVRLEGAPNTGNVDVDLAYNYSGDTYDYYFNNFGRDSLDGNGLKLVSLVKYCPDNSDCPYENAFWDGQQMTYGDGFATADDVVGHELTHGFTEFTSHLFYYYQAGAINESLSDVFGELIDQGNGKGTDTPGVRWQIGEDLPASFGVIRNMADPGLFQDPDRTGSSHYYGGSSDSGGVHSNSGVNNKAAFLMTDGSIFNGQTITGLGAPKVGQIYYKVETSLLTSASDYQDLGDALPAACDSLVGQHSITAADCDQVRKVVLATEMDQTPTIAPATDAAVCTSGTPTNLFSDDLENPSSGNWVSSATAGTNGWYYPQNPNPTFVGDATYATSGEYNFFGFDVSGAPSDYHIRMTQGVQLPAGAFMHFNQAFGFDDLIGNG